MEQNISKEDLEQLQLLKKLEQTREFRIWRDQVCKPLVEQLEGDLANSDGLSEAVLRGKLKHYFSEKYRFYGLFDQVKAQLLLEKEAD